MTSPDEVQGTPDTGFPGGDKPKLILPNGPVVPRIVVPARRKKENDPRVDGVLAECEVARGPIICPCCSIGVGKGVRMITGRLPIYTSWFPRRQWILGGMPCPACRGRGVV